MHRGPLVVGFGNCFICFSFQFHLQFSLPCMIKLPKSSYFMY